MGLLAESQQLTQSSASPSPAPSTAATPSPVLAQPSGVTRTSSVADNLKGLLGQDSGLLKRARGIANQQSSRRGLLNSSLAQEASTAAVIDRALPIAQQDASTTAQFELNDKQFGQNKELEGIRFNNDTSLSKQGFEQSKGLGEQQFGFQSQLNDKQFGQNKELASQQSALQTQQSLKEIAARGSEEERLQKVSAGIQMELSKFNQQSAVQLANLEAANRITLQESASSASRYGSLIDQIGGILGNSALNADSKKNAINVLVEYNRQALDLQGALNGQGATPVAGSPPATPGTATTPSSIGNLLTPTAAASAGSPPLRIAQVQMGRGMGSQLQYQNAKGQWVPA